MFNVIYRRAMRLRSKYESLSQDASKCEDVFNAIYRRGMQLRPKWESLSQDASCGEDANNFISASENKKKTTLRHRNDFHGKVIEFWGLRHRVPSAFWLFLERSALIVVFMSFLLFLRPSPIKLWRNLFKKPIFSVGKRFENNNKKTVKLGKPASKCWMIIVFSLTKLRNCLMKL